MNETENNLSTATFRPKLLPSLSTVNKSKLPPLQINSPFATFSGEFNQNIQRQIPEGYRIAHYSKALDHLHTQAYHKKITQSNAMPDKFQPMEACGSNNEVKQYGLGIYFYLQFIRRLAITFILMSMASTFFIFTNYNGTGLATYSQSFTISMAKMSLGNIVNVGKSQYMMITFADVVSILIFFIFYIHWRIFHNITLEEQQIQPHIINPKSYAVSVVGFYDQNVDLVNLQNDLTTYFNTLHEGAYRTYEVQIVYDYKGYFGKIIDFDNIIQQVQKQKEIVRQTSIHSSQLEQLQLKKNQLKDQLTHITRAFEPMYAIIHFDTLNRKLAYLNYCKKFNLQDTIGQSLQRLICCVHPPPSKNLFLERFPIMIKSTNLSRPEQMNWRNMDLSNLSNIVRWSISIFLVIVSIIMTSAMIGLCTLYVASTSSCQNIVIPPTIAQNDAMLAYQLGGKTLFCYCNSHLQEMYTSQAVGDACSSISSKVLMTNALQIAASLLSTITNVILTFIISLIAKYLLRPSTIPKQHSFIFWGVLISNFINSCAIPLILNANIFGVESVKYLQFIDFMNFKQMSIFNDFTSDWYAMISPYYVNMIIISTFISPFIGLIISCIKSSLTNRKVRKMCENQDGKEPAIQKQVDQIITQNQFELAQEQSQIVLLLFIVIMYSGLMPLLIPIFTIGLIIWYFCKRAAIIKFSIRVPADEGLSQSTINLIPFMILIHALFAVWSHTSGTIFPKQSYLVSMQINIFQGSLNRIFSDIIILGEVVVILIVIIIDYTIINFFSCLRSCCCKDELTMPSRFGEINNLCYQHRAKNTNIVKSYKITKNPIYGHAVKAYKQLLSKNRRHRSQERQNPQNSFVKK